MSVKINDEEYIPMSGMKIIHSFGLSSRYPLITIRQLLILELLKDRVVSKDDIMEKLNLTNGTLDLSLKGLLRSKDNKKNQHSWMFIKTDIIDNITFYSLTPEGNKWMQIL